METLLLNQNDVKTLLSIEECIAGVEQAFKLHALGKAPAPGILGIHAKDGGFHTKAGILNIGHEYFVSKTNANFPHNRQRFGLPTIQGVIVVSDAQDGRLLALVDSIEVTVIRTGAATAIAANYLSNADAENITICGCGNQGRISLKALMVVRRVKKVFAYDIDERVAAEFANELQSELDVCIEVVHDLRRALMSSDICVSCTPSKNFFIHKQDIRPGTFIAAVGADSEDKQELDPYLFGDNKIVVDSLEQASKIGELHHALMKGVVKGEDVHGELGEIIALMKPGRNSKEEIIIFDSTGTALQDVAAAAVVYEKAMHRGIGAKFAFAS